MSQSNGLSAPGLASAPAAASRWDDTTSVLPPPDIPVDLRDLLADFYRIHDPDKLSDVDAIADAYDGRQTDIAIFLETKYATRYFDRYKTNFYSRFFDAARALYDDDVLPPILDIQPMDSLYKAQALLPASVATETGRFVTLGKLHGRDQVEADRKRQEGACGFAVTVRSDANGLKVIYWLDSIFRPPLLQWRWGRVWGLLITGPICTWTARSQCCGRYCCNGLGPASSFALIPDFAGACGALSQHSMASVIWSLTMLRSLRSKNGSVGRKPRQTQAAKMTSHCRQGGCRSTILLQGVPSSTMRYYAAHSGSARPTPPMDCAGSGR